MSDLLKRLERALEFDETSAQSHALKELKYDGYTVGDLINAAHWQSERLRPIHKALMECVSALRGCHACWETTIEPHPVHAALAALEAALREGDL